MSFGLRVAKARKAAHLTQEALARLVGTTSQTISNYERDTVPSPSSSHALAIAKACGVTVSYLLGEQTSPTPEIDDTPGEQDEDVKWAADLAHLDAGGLRILRAVRAQIGPMEQHELLSTAKRIAANAEARSVPETKSVRKAEPTRPRR